MTRTLDGSIDLAMAGGAARKAIANADADAVDRRPYYGFAQSGFAVLEALRAERIGSTGEHPGYRETLAQLGMYVREDGRMMVRIERVEGGVWRSAGGYDAAR